LQKQRINDGWVRLPIGEFSWACVLLPALSSNAMCSAKLNGKLILDFIPKEKLYLLSLSSLI
jgi:hypothetical protein